MSEGVTDVLATLFETGKFTLPTSKKVVTVHKVTLRTMKPVLDFIADVLAELKLTADSLPSVNLQDPVLLLKLISSHFDDVPKLASKLCSLTEDELLDLEADESVLVVQAIVRVNQHFFTTKVRPLLQMPESTPQS